MHCLYARRNNKSCHSLYSWIYPVVMGQMSRLLREITTGISNPQIPNKSKKYNDVSMSRRLQQLNFGDFLNEMFVQINITRLNCFEIAAAAQPHP